MEGDGVVTNFWEGSDTYHGNHCWLGIGQSDHSSADSTLGTGGPSTQGAHELCLCSVAQGQWLLGTQVPVAYWDNWKVHHLLNSIQMVPFLSLNFNGYNLKRKCFSCFFYFKEVWISLLYSIFQNKVTIMIWQILWLENQRWYIYSLLLQKSSNCQLMKLNIFFCLSLNLWTRYIRVRNMLPEESDSLLEWSRHGNEWGSQSDTKKKVVNSFWRLGVGFGERRALKRGFSDTSVTVTLQRRLTTTSKFALQEHFTQEQGTELWNSPLCWGTAISQGLAGIRAERWDVGEVRLGAPAHPEHTGWCLAF